MCCEQVGKEMDKLIAEKLMGWKVIGSDSEGWWTPNRFAYIVPPPLYRSGECVTTPYPFRGRE
ncbi:hypothetical protein Desku_0770 [Desulfofundulus kuznetsovii DSM 6115]|uniref:Uncharacterized protein n=1 Tax=Desulfofundulus kuznetsovii (strain DSM 6115 / VKM B-1805 / 17) TaxID=760568 RepID=A0AAU8PBD7_DESK7|nr:hypothetical protein Desku_0770 [Desulfofundulus kuznetsovii DSM 6115]